MTRPPRGRRGAFLAEAVIATAVLVAALAMTARLLGGLAGERRALERRQVAAEAAANLVERFAALDPAERTPERLASLNLDPEALDALPDARLEATLDGPDSESEADLIRLVVHLRWADRPGREEAPVRLVAWLAGPKRQGEARP